MKPRDLKQFIGLKVKSAQCGIDPKGYGFVTIEFIGGEFLTINEEGQTGEISVSIPGEIIWPQRNQS